tara:strand:+ start:2294 stop:2803 length:510 start_codon:yes stop_codon:yes gene_type:complete
MVLAKNKFYPNLLKLAPIILLYIAVLNDFDFNYIKYFSFNFPFILIYYWSLKKSESLGYGYIFIAGLINDVVVGFPIGFTSINYLLICGFAGYLRNITLRPRMVQDWLFFLLTISFVNSINFIVLNMLLAVKIDYLNLFYNTFFTFALYLVFANLFKIYQTAVFKEIND